MSRHALVLTTCLIVLSHLVIAQSITTGAGGACTNMPLLFTGNTNQVYKIEWIKNSSTVEKINYREWVNPAVVAGIEGSNGNSTTQFTFPTQIHVTPAGSLYVVDHGNGRVQRWDPPYTSGVTVASGLDWPHDITIDLFGNLLVTEHWGKRVSLWPGNTTVANIGSGAEGIAMGPGGMIYVVEYWTGRVRMYPPLFTTASPSVVRAGDGSNGNNGNHQLNFPNDICVDPFGNMYVLDTDNDRIMSFPSWSVEGSPGTPIVTNMPLSFHSAIYRDIYGYLFFTSLSGTYIIEPGGAPRRILNWGNAGVQSDLAGNLFVSGDHCVKKLTPEVAHFYHPTTPGWYHARVTYLDGTVVNTNSINVLQGPSTPVIGYNGPVCAGTSINLTANSLAGVSWHWDGPSGYTSGIQNPVINGANAANGGQYSVYATENSNGCRSLSSYLNVVVTPTVVPSVTIARNAGTNIFCAGSSVSFMATAVNGGAAPTYQWTINGNPAGTGNTLTTSTLNDGDIVRCRLTSNAACATPASVNSNTITMRMSPPATLATPGICAGTLLTVNTAANVASIEWFKGTASQTTGTSNTFIATTDGTYHAVVKSTEGCTSITNSIVIHPNNTAFVTSVSATDGIYRNGDNIDITAHFNEAVTLNTTGGTPSVSITLNTGGVVQANYISGSGTTSIVFRYTVGATEQDPDGITIGSMNLNGGVFQNVNGCTVLYSLNNIAPATGVIVHNYRPQTITFSITDKYYGDPDFDPAAVASSGLPVTYTSSNTAVATIVGGQIHILNAGITTITAFQPGNADHFPATPVQQTLTVYPRAIAVNTTAGSKVYGSSDPVFTFTYSPALIGTDAFSGTLSRVAGENIGTYTINQGTLALSPNYTITFNSAGFAITPKTITVIAAAKTKIYGNPDPALTYAYSPALVTGDAFTGSLTRTAGENTGAYPINQGSLTLSPNYILIYTNADLTVTPKTITVTAGAKTKVYGNADPALTYTYAPALIAGDAFTGSLIRTAGENAGNYNIIQNTLSLSGNYQLTYVPAAFVITKAVLTVTSANESVCQNEELHSVPVSYTGFKNGDGAANLTQAPQVIIPHYSTEGNYMLIPAGGSAINYTFIYINGQLTVIPIPQGSIGQVQIGPGVINTPGINSGMQLNAPFNPDYTYHWSTNESTASILVKQSGIFSVNVTNLQNCTNRFTVQVKQQTLIIPNIFSPNGDGTHDKWVIGNLENYPGNVVQIYNRYGQLIHRVVNFTGWDGRVKGQDMPAGTYYYIIDPKNGNTPTTGYIDIIR